jgi:hypothetical protein
MGVREGKSVKQRTLLNLGVHFDLAQDDWPSLTARIDEILHGRTLFPVSDQKTCPRPSA